MSNSGKSLGPLSAGWHAVRDFSGLAPGASTLWPRWAMLRAVGVVFVVIFSGIIAESSALIGPNGLLPLPRLLEQARADHTGVLDTLLHRPSVFWINADPAMIAAVEWGGLLAAVALVLNFFPRLALFICWLALLSFARVWVIFSEPQLDWLMLEVALLCIPFAPAGLRPGLGGASPPSPLALFMMRWLLLRVMFGPGLAKLIYGDPHWLNFTAMDVLYESAPSPTIVGYFNHHLPHAWHVVEWVLTFAAEIVAPLLAVFGGRRGRWIALVSWTALQAGIQLNCNYGWLNTAAIGLGLLLLDDQMLARTTGFLRRRLPAWSLPAPAAPTPAAPGLGWKKVAVATGLWAHFALSIAVYWDKESVPPVLLTHGSSNAFKLYAHIDPVHRVTEFTGSNDGGRTWRAYEFFHYPQQLDRMSGFIAPHFPRFEGTLQIVLATRPEPHSIYAIVAGHLLAQNPEIVRLFRENPFPDRPPQMIRMATYRYRFTDLETYRTTGNFWRREYEGDYLPMIYLNERQEIVRAESEIAVTRIKAHYQNPDAQNRLGLHLVNGELGLSRDPVQAAGWFRRAAELGLADAQFNLSLFLLNGDGARPDLPQAALWCQRAAKQGLTNAQDLLGLMYARGDGVPKDPVEALAWFMVAANLGHQEAARRANLLKAELRPDAVARAESRARSLRTEIEAAKKSP